MKYFSLTTPSHKVSFQQAIVSGLAPDGGLYMPEQLPVLPTEFIAQLSTLSKTEIGFSIARPFVDENISDETLREIVSETIDFDFPVVALEENVFALELFHGPTLAFKDVGARFLARILRQIAKTIHQEITVLVATSGDTGSAVAHGFYNVEGIRVVILYPSGMVSALQEKQFATLGKNIQAIKVAGTFDDCQRLVKQAFQDEQLRKTRFLTSANSINIARLIPQSFYYFLAWSQLNTPKQVVFSVPSGNFGNLTAGVLAKKMGLPIRAFVAATNVNDVVPEYLHTNIFKPRASTQTISNAMDVGNPSNFPRLLALYGNDWGYIHKEIHGYAFTDAKTRLAMLDVFNRKKYILDPHGAVGYLGLKKYLESHPDVQGMFLETAHPSKFPDVVESAIQQPISIHPSLAELANKQIQSLSSSSNFSDFKNLLMMH
ncbi:MAG: threonine synthase [Cyclobacteriaceae bacterium]|nr:threonine synthase [Cyclobacteriaceae bacterium]UYN86320.1 MAG: threonine synthase [Cyclobacteriaceae bacterium]